MAGASHSDSTTMENRIAENSFCYPNLNVLYFEIVDSSVPYVVNSTLNVLLAIVAAASNALVFTAVYRTKSIRKPSRLLLLSLILTDLGVGVIVQPQFVVFLITKLHGALAVSCFCLNLYGCAGDVLSSVSLLTMTAICIDRYIAFYYPLRYQEIVTTRKVGMVLLFIWSLAAFFAASLFWSRTVHANMASSGFAVCLSVICVAYVKIYRGLRSRNGRQIHNHEQTSENNSQPETGTTLNISNYRRTITSMLWIYSLFILCYSPYIFVRVFIAFYRYNVVIRCVYEFVGTCVFLNSSLNPFVYFFRRPEIRRKVMQILNNLY